ncbi:MAG: deoxyribodipyrimidine photolyase, partial [Methanomicrobiales archaeon]|nr:deoxyribodipyrimidine photolyase [Methanomicrobiales archaeon]
THAERLALPLVACFVVTPGFPDARGFHYRFLAEGLGEVERDLANHGVRLVTRFGDPADNIPALAAGAALVVTDCGYLRIQREWRETVSHELPCRFCQVETNVVVPVHHASPKEEWSAATFRKKITPLIDRFLVPSGEKRPGRSSLSLDPGVDTDPAAASFLATIAEAGGEHRVPWQGGERAAHGLLDRFITERLDRYASGRNDPNADALSCMSPYLHFGQISPLDIALRITATGHPDAGVYLEELIVRRELAMNFVFYNPGYDRYEGLPGWAKKTLGEHAGDIREYSYRFREFEEAATHDPYWNAAQDEMRFSGKMHGYMRMYWGKKILEWSESPEEGYRIALGLNNGYELDGRDPNGFTGVAWCFGKHDRAWAERPVYGKIRYMNAHGLKRKFDADRYVERVGELKEHAGHQE